MKELKTKERKNSLMNKYSDEKSSILDSLVKNSAYLNMWEEILHPPLGEIHILLKFSSRLEPTDQIYSNIANEIYISDINVKIVEQTENAVIIQLSNTEEILKEL